MLRDEAAASYSPTQFAHAVPSAQRSLTTVFGMGTGVASSPLPPPQAWLARDANRGPTLSVFLLWS